MSDLAQFWARPGQLFDVTLVQALRARQEFFKQEQRTHAGRRAGVIVHELPSRPGTETRNPAKSKKKINFSGGAFISDTQMITGSRSSLSASQTSGAAAPEPASRPAARPSQEQTVNSMKNSFEMVVASKHAAGSSHEITSFQGERVVVLVRNEVWWWVRNARREEGYIPMMKLSTPEGVPAVLAFSTSSAAQKFSTSPVQLRKSIKTEPQYAKIGDKSNRDSAAITNILQKADSSSDLPEANQPRERTQSAAAELKQSKPDPSPLSITTDLGNLGNPNLPPRRYSEQFVAASTVVSTKPSPSIQRKAETGTAAAAASTSGKPTAQEFKENMSAGQPPIALKQDPLPEKSHHDIIRERQEALKRPTRLTKGWASAEDDMDAQLRKILSQRRQHTDAIQLVAEAFRSNAHH